MNALKTGLYAKSLIIPGEDPTQLAALTDEYYQRYRPIAPAERDQVDILIRSVWTLRRLGAAEAQVWTYEIDTAYHPNHNAPLGQAFIHCDRALSRLQRSVNSTQRNYRDALHELERLQSLHLDPDLNLNLDPAPARPQAPDPSPEPPSDPPAPGPSARPPACPPDPQPAETEPFTPATQFVSSTSVPPSSEAPLPFHKPGSRCPFRPAEEFKSRYRQCPVCFPDTQSNHD
jgi:hypothetical protein